MSYLPQLKLLVTLARVDGDIAEKEKQYLINIGLANHLLAAEILPLLSGDHPMTLPDHLSEEQKFDYIFSLVQLMKIDERIYSAEIKYCAQVASRLGYHQDVLFELMLKVKAVAMEKNEVEALRKLTTTYLIGS